MSQRGKRFLVGVLALVIGTIYLLLGIYTIALGIATSIIFGFIYREQTVKSVLLWVSGILIGPFVLFGILSLFGEDVGLASLAGVFVAPLAMGVSTASVLLGIGIRVVAQQAQ